MIELKIKESLLCDGLTLKHVGGGHKITMDENGRRSGDLSFADVLLSTKKLTPKKVRLFHPNIGEKVLVEFENYVVTVAEVGWNGAFVRLEISKNQ